MTTELYKRDHQQNNPEISQGKISQPYHHGNLYDSLIKAGTELLEEKGVDRLSLREVAKKIGVSHTAPYRHFKDKNALMIAIAQKAYDELGEYLTEKIYPHQKNPTLQLEVFASSYLEFSLENKPFISLMFSGLYKSEKAFNFSDSENSCFQLLQSIIANGQSDGCFEKAPTSLQALSVWTSLHGLSMLFASEQIPSVDNKDQVIKLSRALIKNLIAGIGASPKAIKIESL